MKKKYKPYGRIKARKARKRLIMSLTKHFAMSLIPVYAVVMCSFACTIYTAHLEAIQPLMSLGVKGAEAHVVEVSTSTLVDQSPLPSETQLRNYLLKYNSPLAQYSGEIIKRYPENYRMYIGITRIESSFCKNLAQTGGKTAINNCVNIKSSRKDRVFKFYNSMLDSIEDLHILLQRPLYVDKTINEISGGKRYLKEIIILVKTAEQKNN